MAFKTNCGQQSIKIWKQLFIFKALKCSFLYPFCFLSYFYYQGVPQLFLFSLVNATSLLFNWLQTHLYTSRIRNTGLSIECFLSRKHTGCAICGMLFSVYTLNTWVSAKTSFQHYPLSLFLSSFRHTHPPWMMSHMYPVAYFPEHYASSMYNFVLLFI